jgi:hypothetical protein
MGLRASTRLLLQVNATRGNALRQRLNNVTYFTATTCHLWLVTLTLLQGRLTRLVAMRPVLAGQQAACRKLGKAIAALQSLAASCRIYAAPYNECMHACTVAPPLARHYDITSIS